MTCSIKRLRKKGDYRLTNLQSVENLDVFISEVDKTTRLWIDSLDVFATSRRQEKQSYDGYNSLKCDPDRDRDSDISHYVNFYENDVASLALTIERVFCLNDSRHDRIVHFSRPNNRASSLKEGDD